MSEIPKELSEFVNTTINAAKQGIKEHNGTLGPIKFDLAVIKTDEASGGLKIFVASLKGKHEKEIISRISFEWIPGTDWE